MKKRLMEIVMKFDKTLKQLESLNTTEKFIKQKGPELYTDLFNLLDKSNENQYHALSNKSEKLTKMLLDSQDFTLALKLHKIEIDYFQEHFNIEKLAKAYQKTTKVYTMLGAATFSKPGDQEQNFRNIVQNFIDHFEYSIKFLNQRWNKLLEETLKTLDEFKGSSKAEFLESINEQMKNLIMESNFHIVHFVDYLKKTYSELEKMYQKVQELSINDELTGIHNRRYLDSNYSDFYRLANRQKVPIGLLLFDLDDFKTVNDNYGHQSGDKVLAKTAELLKESIRASDILVRYGGDEFLVLLFNINLKNSIVVAEIIRNKIAKQVFQKGNKKFQISISAGISCMNIEGIKSSSKIESTYKSMLVEADKALYFCKKNGKDQYKVYEKKIKNIL